MESVLAEEGVSSLFAPGENVLFLNSWQPDTHPIVAARMMRLCLKLQQLSGVQTFFVTGNLKVSAEDMERVFQEAKAAGTIFIRSSRHFPTLQSLPDGRVRMTYHDEVTRGNFYMTADGVIVDESLCVDPFLSQVADSLRLAPDSDGFLQQDNVRRLSHETNRRGIFVAAAARSFFPQSAMIAEAGQAALKAWTYTLSSSHPDSFPKTSPKVATGATIDQGACARCLTCYRLCPYAAIDMSPRMSVHPEACQACGLCRAGCPNRAIHIDDRQLNDTIGTLLEKKIEPGQQPAAVPNIVAFCCERSAAQSRRMALGMGHRLPAGMVFVEGLCGGTLSVHDVLRSFEAGADGVMVLTCHEGNCHSDRGTHYARKRVSEASRCLSQAGVSSDRIHYSTLASNMMHAFVRRAEDFAKQIARIGPLQQR
jgi:coenzyme F420-reducing hydrogenase delta subunit/Pyruvate/2-oxoacid:ferredoxin oxidoreductase delta subunit